MSPEIDSDEEFVKKAKREHENFRAKTDLKAMALRGRRSDRLHSEALSAKMEDREV